MMNFTILCLYFFVLGSCAREIGWCWDCWISICPKHWSKHRPKRWSKCQSTFVDQTLIRIDQNVDHRELGVWCITLGLASVGIYLNLGTGGYFDRVKLSNAAVLNRQESSYSQLGFSSLWFFWANFFTATVKTQKICSRLPSRQIRNFFRRSKTY